MADIISDGMIRASWVPTIANLNAPTVAELNAGIQLELTLTRDGLMGLKADTAAVDNTHLASKFGTSLAGTASYSGPGLRLKKQSGSDTIFATLTRNTTGNLVVRRWVESETAWTAAQVVQVYPMMCGELSLMDSEQNTTDRYEIPLFPSSEPKLRAVVAA